MVSSRSDCTDWSFGCKLKFVGLSRPIYFFSHEFGKSHGCMAQRPANNHRPEYETDHERKYNLEILIGIDAVRVPGLQSHRLIQRLHFVGHNVDARQHSDHKPDSDNDACFKFNWHGSTFAGCFSISVKQNLVVCRI